MSQNDIRGLVLSAILDKELRSALAADPEKVIEEKGYTANPKQIATLKALNPAEWDNVTVGELGERYSALLSGSDRSKIGDVEGIPIK